METFIFTDGASKGNPGPGGWGAVIQKKDSIEEIGNKEIHTTNNRMELTAVAKAIERASQGEKRKIVVFTDSSYVINGITKWIYNWEKNNWKTKAKKEVLNVDLWKQLSSATNNQEIEWRYVPGHSDIAGNERANDIAEAFALNKTPKLYSGAVAEYSKNLLLKRMPLDRDGKVSLLKKYENTKKRKSGIAYSYVSLLDGKIERHKTWDECKAHVEGKRARFKKAYSKEEEEEIIREYKQ